MTERESQLTDWARRLERLGVTRQDIERHGADLTKQFGFEAAANDVIWRVLNAVVSASPRGPAAKGVYLEMAQIARGEGKSPLPYLREAATVELLEIKQTGVAKAVRTQTANDHLVCSRCRALEGRKLSLDEAIASLPVPNECTNEDGCRCWYSAVLEWE